VTDLDAILTIESEDTTEYETIQAFQHLINSGVVWSLQGWYGRTAHHLIQSGVCTGLNEDDQVPA
jgi:hypothetical protein